MEEKKSRYFTLMIMPDSSTLEVRRIRVSRRMLTASLAALVLVFIASAGAFAHGSYFWEEARENAALRGENEVLRSRLEALDLRLEGIGEAMERIKQLDSKLRSITMVSDPERNLAIGPVGGAAEEQLGGSLGAQGDLRRELLGPAVRAVDLVQSRVAELESETENTAKSVSALAAYLEDQEAVLSSTPSRAPARGFVSSIFGMRVDPFTGLPTLHAGIDFSANIGAPVYASADGLVVFTGMDGAYGRAVRLEHGNGMVTHYAHLSNANVKVGEQVRRGQIIGAVGNTGRSTGPHLHYEVRINGVPTNPQRFLLE